MTVETACYKFANLEKEMRFQVFPAKSKNWSFIGVLNRSHEGFVEQFAYSTKNIDPTEDTFCNWNWNFSRFIRSWIFQNKKKPAPKYSKVSHVSGIELCHL